MKTPKQQFIDLGLVKVKDIATNPDNKDDMEDGAFVRLKSEISNNGFIKKKIIVRKVKGAEKPYMVIDGNHHLDAADELGYKFVPCLLYIANWDGVSS